MPVAPTYPGVYIEEIPSGVRTITGVATSITAFIGRTLRGPVNDPVRVQSFAEFERRFGGLWRDNVDVLLSEDSEAYEVDVLSDADVVLATYTVTSHTTTVTAAQQTALFGGLKTGMKVVIYQLSASAGRGYPLAGTV